MRMYEPRDRTIGRILADKAERIPDRVFLVFEGREWTYAQLDAVTNGFAEGFRRLGVERGQHVALVLGNCPEILFAIWGLGKLGAVAAPLNTAAKGDVLDYLVSQSDSVMVCPDAQRHDRIVAAAALAPQRPTVVDFDTLASFADITADRPAGWEEIRSGDPHLLMYTSGTTGPSKGVICPHSQGHVVGLQMVTHCRYTSDDRLFTCLPLFHANALWFSVYAALWAEATLIVSPGFSARRFWQDIRDSGATEFNALGAMANIIWQQPPSELDRQHSVRTALVVPLSTDLAQRFRDRYGIKVTSVYAMTENTALTVLGVDEPHSKASSAGPVRDNVDIRVVDDHDHPVPIGEIGEIVIRTADPGAFMLGYYRMPETTAESTRGLWFHTGDRGWLDEDAYLYFSDRKKEAIRRRGENISAYEVEVVLASHPAVLEAAAVPVPSELGEDEVMAYVVLNEGAQLDFADLIEHAAERMAYYMVPRYLDVIDELPKTSSQKLEKYKLTQSARERLGELWDREKAGIVVQR